MGAACSTVSIQQTNKILLIGPRDSGKTTLLYSWVLGKDSVVETKPTESFDVEKVIVNESRDIILVWDVSDTARRRQFYYGTEAVVYVLDSSKPDDLPSVQADLHSVLKNSDLSDVPVLVVANKRDIKNSLTAADVEKCLELSTLQDRRYAVVEVSTSDWDSVEAVLVKVQELLHPPRPHSAKPH